MIGKVVVSTIKPMKNGGYVIRVYNPSDEAQAFCVGNGERFTQSVVSKRAVISVVLEQNEIRIEKEKLSIL